jgi:hypothetical protein
LTRSDEPQKAPPLLDPPDRSVSVLAEEGLQLRFVPEMDMPFPGVLIPVRDRHEHVAVVRAEVQGDTERILGPAKMLEHLHEYDEVVLRPGLKARDASSEETAARYGLPGAADRAGGMVDADHDFQLEALMQDPQKLSAPTA